MYTLKKLLASHVTMILLMAVYAVTLAAATFIEKAFGTPAAKMLVYYSPVFFLLQLLLAVNFLAVFVSSRGYKSGKWGFMAIHLAFIIILSGALISHVTGKEGMLHLREGEKSAVMKVQTSRGTYMHRFPFEVELIRFTLKRYPGSMSPSSYESELRVYVDGEIRRERVYMNNVLDVKGYRFFQASFDADERGTILSVNKDAAGRRVTYAGYLLLLAGGILCLTGKKGRIRSLYGQLKRRETPSKLFCLLLCFSVAGAGVTASAAEAAVLASASASAAAEASASDFSGDPGETMQSLLIAPEHAERFGSLPVQTVAGRIVPVNTFASDVLRKLRRDTKFGQMNPDQFLLSVLAYPEMWMYVPLIDVPDKNFALYFGLTRGHCAFAELFESNGSYKLQERLEEAYRKMPDGRTAFDKDLIKFDERVNIFNQLLSRQLIRLFPAPADPSQRWYAPGDDAGVEETMSAAFDDYLAKVRAAVRSQKWDEADKALETIRACQYADNNVPEMTADRIALELRYNRMDIFRWCKIGYLTAGGVLLLFSFLLLFGGGGWMKWVIRISGILVLIIFHYQMMGMGMRWKIGGYAPWSNSYETMVYAAWATVFGGLMFVRRSPLTFALATLFAGVILFVSSLSLMDPQINPLVPVLKSPWLMFHVAVIMAAYGFFGISCLIGATNLILMRLAASFPAAEAEAAKRAGSIRELSLINEISLNIGLILMTVGCFMGAVWAN